MMALAKIKVELLEGEISEEQHRQLQGRFQDILADVLSAPVVNVQVAFKLGDVVMLNSGGPEMTVTEIKNDYVFTQWFTKTAEPSVMSDSFYLGTLRKVKE